MASLGNPLQNKKLWFQKARFLRKSRADFLQIWFNLISRLFPFKGMALRTSLQNQNFENDDFPKSIRKNASFWCSCALKCMHYAYERLGAALCCCPASPRCACFILIMIEVWISLMRYPIHTQFFLTLPNLHTYIFKKIMD